MSVRKALLIAICIHAALLWALNPIFTFSQPKRVKAPIGVVLLPKITGKIASPDNPNQSVIADSEEETGRSKWTIYKPPPVYPERARQKEWEGTVVIEIETDLSGFVANARVYSSSGYAILDKRALKSLGKWRLEANIKDQVPVVFQLY